MSLKALANKVLDRNKTGISKEYLQERQGINKDSQGADIFHASVPIDDNVLSPLPYLDASGSLVIPFGSEKRYHWWNRGQSVTETKREIISNVNT